MKIFKNAGELHRPPQTQKKTTLFISRNKVKEMSRKIDYTLHHKGRLVKRENGTKWMKKNKRTSQDE